MKQQIFGLVLGAVVALFGVTAQSNAQSYPNKTVRIIAAYAPGGGTDVLARLVAKKLSDEFGQPIIVENRPGADGVIAGGAVANSPSDGYTLLVVGSGLITTPTTRKNAGYDPDEALAPVAKLTQFSVLLVVPANSPIKSVDDLIAKAKIAEKPLTYATPASGGVSHLAGELFKKMTGVNLIQVPFTGSAPATTALLGNHVDMQFAAPQSVISQVRSGQLRALAYGGEARSASFPDVPTLEELGLKGYKVMNSLGLFAPGKTPTDIIERISAATSKAMREKDTIEFLERDGSEIAAGTPAQFKKQLSDETVLMNKMYSELPLSGK